MSDIPSLTVKSKYYNVQHGQNVTLECSITAVPHVTNVYWQKQTDDSTINITSIDQRVYGVSHSVPSLTLINTHTADSGLYTCYADNLLGSGHSQNTNLSVFGSKYLKFLNED